MGDDHSEGSRITGHGIHAAGDEGSMRHHLAITEDDGGYESLLGLLPCLAAPALLITAGTTR